MDILRFSDIFGRIIWSKIYKFGADCNNQEINEILEIADSPEKDNRLLIMW